MVILNISVNYVIKTKSKGISMENWEILTINIEVISLIYGMPS